MWVAYQDPGFVLTKVTIPEECQNVPVSGVSREDAEDFCVWLSKRSGLKVRLPSLAEWQSAAHGNDVRRLYPWGEIFDAGFTIGIWAQDGGRRNRPIASGSVPADCGPFGHLDLGGNLNEWVADQTNTHGAIVAGGAWAGDRPGDFHTTATQSTQPFFTNATIGFRILVELP